MENRLQFALGLPDGVRPDCQPVRPGDRQRRDDIQLTGFKIIEQLVTGLNIQAVMKRMGCQVEIHSLVPAQPSRSWLLHQIRARQLILPLVMAGVESEAKRAGRARLLDPVAILAQKKVSALFQDRLPTKEVPGYEGNCDQQHCYQEQYNSDHLAPP